MSSHAEAERHLLYYRPWQGHLHPQGRLSLPVFLLIQIGLLVCLTQLSAWPVLRLILSVVYLGLWTAVVRLKGWPIARISLVMIFRRKLFWGIYALALMVFLMFFFGQYLMSWAATQLGETEVRVGGMGRANPRVLVDFFRDALKLNGSRETFHLFFRLENYSIMLILALAGSVLIGNDLRFGSLPFFLSRPISIWDYLTGKGLAVAAFINLITTLPAVILYIQWGMLEDWDYFFTSGGLLVGILAYGMILTVTLTIVLLATASWVRRTVPLIMTWTSLFFFCPLLSIALVDKLYLDPRWRLIDLGNSTYLLGGLCLGFTAETIRPTPQPHWFEAALILAGVILTCLSYLVLRIRAVEIVK